MTDLAERLLTQWGPLALGWVVAAVLGYALWRIGHGYIRALTQSGSAGEGVAATLESLETHMTSALSSTHKRLDSLEDRAKNIERHSSWTSARLKRATPKLDGK